MGSVAAERVGPTLSEIKDAARALRREAVLAAVFYEVARADRACGLFVRLSPSLGRLPALVQLVLRTVPGGLPTHMAVGTRFVDSATRRAAPIAIAWG